MKETMKKAMKNLTVGKVLTYVFLLLGVYVMLVPFLWMISTSFKTFLEAMRVPPQFLPDAFLTENYEKVFEMNLGRYYINTIIVTAAITLAQLLFGSMAAFAFARVNFPFKNLIFWVLLAVLMVPTQLTLIPRYAICNKLGLINSLWAIIIPQMFSVTVTFFMRQAFLSLPADLENAARIDGCSRFRFFWEIAMPLCKSTLVSMAILVGLYAWNDLLWPIVATSSDSTRVLSVFIAAIKGEYNNRIPILMAAGSLSVLPMIICFIIGQKQFVAAITTTGLKD